MITIDPHLSFTDFFDNKELKIVAYNVSKALSDGHICLDIAMHNRDVENGIVEVELEQTLYFEKIDIDTLKESEYISFDGNANSMFVINNSKVYLQRYWVYETSIITKITEIIQSTDKTKMLCEVESAIPFIRSQFEESVSGTDWQLLSTINSCLNRFSIVTGGPGTGKTYTVAKILSILLKLHMDETVVMVAPTGKAAARMKSSLDSAIVTGLNVDDELREKLTSIESKTIHSLLGYKKGTHRFKHNRDNRLKKSIIIADEASMIDASMMSKLLEAVNDNARVILLGDKNQLASVEAGSVFGDLCRVSGEDISDISQESLHIYNEIKKSRLKVSEHKNILSSTVSELKESRRFVSTEGIGLFSSSVINGDDLILDNSQFYVDNSDAIELFDDDVMLNKLIKKYEAYINEKEISEALKKFDDFRILCATKNGNFGVEEINSRVEKILKLNGKKDASFYHNQPIMIRKNDRTLDIYNGDTGIVRKCDDKKLYFFMDGREGISVALLPKCETAFAMTIHKSQGSDYKEVAVLYPEEESKILSRELLYTAVTRAKKKVYVFGKREVLRSSINRAVNRASGIIDRIS